MSGVEGDGVDKDLLARSESSPDEVVSPYDEWATAEYDADVEGWGYDAPRQIASLVAAHLSERKPGDAEVLDAGCGTGRDWSARRCTPSASTGSSAVTSRRHHSTRLAAVTCTTGCCRSI
jgi:hypothetical protein